jgi:protein-L-isoaspartate O-methyltransferase
MPAEASFEEVIGAVMRLSTAADTLAAMGARLALAGQGGHPDAELDRALVALTEAAGIPDVTTLPAPQRELVLAVTRMFLGQAADLVREPERPRGWSVTDPMVLDGYGRGSTMIPGLLAGAAPELAGVRSLLDVGTGVGLLAVAATAVWPEATVTGIDVWEPSLERARANVERAGLTDRITLRHQDLAALDDSDAFDCAWVPTFFFDAAEMPQVVAAVVRAVRPGGWTVLGRYEPPADGVARAANDVHTIRGGGHTCSEDDAVALLKGAGCTSVRALERTWPVPLLFVIGQKP